MASSVLISFFVCSIFFLKSSALNYSSSSSSSSSSNAFLESHLSSIRSVCRSTPYPDVCYESLKLSVSINISPNILNYLLQSLQIALSEAGKLTSLFDRVGPSDIIEKQRGAIQDCKDLHQITTASLMKSVSRIKSSADSQKLADARAFLSAALTNKNTCLEGLESTSGPLKPTLVDSITSFHKHISNSLSLLPKIKPKPAATGTSSTSKLRRHLLGHNKLQLGYPKWLSRNVRRILQSSSGTVDDNENDYDPSLVLSVAPDGTGNFTTITEAINFAPNNSEDRISIYVRQGVYQENVDIPIYKPNIVLLGDGSDVTVITGNRSVMGGWTTFRSATVAVSGEGFLARDITFENTAGPENRQAVALRINTDFAALYRCSINGYQDTLYVHSFRQFYRECEISGTIDFIFGNAAVVFQACNIISRMPMPGQFTVIAAQSRDSPDEDTGISIQNCTIAATDELYNSSGVIKSYLGRPWRLYARTVYIESFIDDFIDPAGWTKWSVTSDDRDQAFETLYYGEYENAGPGSATDNRVAWPGFHLMDYDDASNFTVSQFITGDEWLDSTSFPYDDGI